MNSTCVLQACYTWCMCVNYLGCMNQVFLPKYFNFAINSEISLTSDGSLDDFVALIMKVWMNGDKSTVVLLVYTERHCWAERRVLLRDFQSAPNCCYNLHYGLSQHWFSVCTFLPTEALNISWSLLGPLNMRQVCFCCCLAAPLML